MQWAANPYTTWSQDMAPQSPWQQCVRISLSWWLFLLVVWWTLDIQQFPVSLSVELRHAHWLQLPHTLPHHDPASWNTQNLHHHQWKYLQLSILRFLEYQYGVNVCNSETFFVSIINPWWQTLRQCSEIMDLNSTLTMWTAQEVKVLNNMEITFNY